MNVTVLTHIGPLQTQIRETDTVQSFLLELKEAISQRMNLDAAPKWHYLTHNSRILKPSTLLTAVLKHPGEEVVYIRPLVGAVASSSLSQSTVSKSVKPLRPSTSTPVPINVSSSSHASPPVTPVKLGPSLPPTSYFNAESLADLQGMGFSSQRVKQALLMFDGKFEPALDWLLSLADPEDSVPLQREDQALFDLALAQYLQSHPE